MTVPFYIVPKLSKNKQELFSKINCEKLWGGLVGQVCQKDHILVIIRCYVYELTMFKCETKANGYEGSS
ncbi:hypothetical protein K1719_023744 [Acacia pycnantha]|nr:hypothetical protein K1719_023744 [Acacia pycnantha]